MSQEINSRQNRVKQNGPVWKTKIAVYSAIGIDKKQDEIRIKRWKIKEILN